MSSSFDQKIRPSRTENGRDEASGSRSRESAWSKPVQRVIADAGVPWRHDWTRKVAQHSSSKVELHVQQVPTTSKAVDAQLDILDAPNIAGFDVLVDDREERSRLEPRPLFRRLPSTEDVIRRRPSNR